MKPRILSIRRSRPRAWRWALGSVVIVGVAAGVLFSRDDAVQPQATSIARSGATPTVESRSDDVVAAPGSAPAQPGSRPTARANETPSAMFNRLSLSTEPSEKLAAFLVLNRCDTAIHWVDVPNVTPARPSTEGCDGLTLDGVHQANALPLILSAAEAGVPGAFRELMFVRGRYDTDPLFQASYERIVDINVAKGDEQANRARWAIDYDRRTRPMVESLLASNAAGGRKP